MPYEWHKINSRKWLFGSIRFDMESKHRGVWGDLLAMARLNDRPGYIESTKGQGYGLEYLANIFNISKELLKETLDLCIEEGRITMNGTGVIHLTNFGTYQDVPENKVKRQMTGKEIEFLERKKLAELVEKYPGDTLQHKIRAMAKGIIHVDTATGEEVSPTLPPTVKRIVVDGLKGFG